MKYILFIIFSIFTILSNAQFEEDIKEFENIQFYKKDKKPDYSYAESQTETFKIVFSGLFLFYKHFVSSQDNSNCPFEISCSVYMLKSVQKKGAFIGLLNGLDRLKRCNGYSNHKYDRNPKTGRLIDPIE